MNLHYINVSKDFAQRHLRANGTVIGFGQQEFTLVNMDKITLTEGEFTTELCVPMRADAIEDYGTLMMQVGYIQALTHEDKSEFDYELVITPSFV